MKAVVPKARPLLDAGGVSLTDIIMNLFVFFFIAFALLANFAKPRPESQSSPDERQQQILLPASQREAPAVSSDAVLVELGLEERTQVDGQAVSASKVTAAVQAALGPNRKTVVVRAHKDLSLGATVSLMDQIWAAGPESVAIATLPGGARP